MILTLIIGGSLGLGLGYGLWLASRLGNGLTGDRERARAQRR